MQSTHHQSQDGHGADSHGFRGPGLGVRPGPASAGRATGQTARLCEPLLAAPRGRSQVASSLRQPPRFDRHGAFDVVVREARRRTFAGREYCPWHEHTISRAPSTANSAPEAVRETEGGRGKESKGGNGGARENEPRRVYPGRLRHGAQAEREAKLLAPQQHKPGPCCEADAIAPGQLAPMPLLASCHHAIAPPAADPPPMDAVVPAAPSRPAADSAEPPSSSLDARSME